MNKCDTLEEGDFNDKFLTIPIHDPHIYYHCIRFRVTRKSFLCATCIIICLACSNLQSHNNELPVMKELILTCIKIGQQRISDV